MDFSKEIGAVLFDGYYEGGGLDGDKPSGKVRLGKGKPKPYEIAVRQFQWLLGKIKQTIIMTDYDSDESFQCRLKMAKALDQRCVAIAGAHKGGHIYWANSTQAVIVSNSKRKTVLTLTPVDYKCGMKLIKSTGEVKPSDTYGALSMDDGSFRDVVYCNIGEDGTLDELPFYDRPLKSGEKHAFLGMGEGDGRQDGLFTFMLPMKSAGYTYEQYAEAADLINRFVFGEALDEEFDNAKRREAWDAVDTVEASDFMNAKGQFLHDKFAKFLRQDAHIIKLNGQLHIYRDGVYVSNYGDIESQMIKYIPTLNRAKRTEVLAYLEILIQDNMKAAEANFIAFENGVYDLTNGSFSPFTPDHIITNKIPWNYVPDSYSELADETLDKIACHDPEIRALLEEAIGYCFFRRNELRKCFILTGDKHNGKSTFLFMIQTLLGDRNIAALDLKELGDRFKTAELFGKLANIGDDIGDEFIANASIFRKLVTGDRVSVERKGRDPFEFNNYSKFLFSANNIPRIKDRTGAVMDRLIIIPFNAQFSKNDPGFRPYIKYELQTPEVMQYLILIGLKGLNRVMENNSFTTSQKVEQEMREYEEANNPILSFIRECEQEEFQIENEPTNRVYKRYLEFCIANSFQPMSNIEFPKQLRRILKLKIVDRKIDGKKCRIFVKDE